MKPLSSEEMDTLMAEFEAEKAKVEAEAKAASTQEGIYRTTATTSEKSNRLKPKTATSKANAAYKATIEDRIVDAAGPLGLFSEEELDSILSMAGSLCSRAVPSSIRDVTHH